MSASVSMGISTSGYSPAAAVVLKKKINEMLPDDTDVIMEYMNSKRSDVIQRFPDYKQRTAFFTTLFETCLDEGRVLTDFEYQKLIDGFGSV